MVAVLCYWGAYAGDGYYLSEAPGFVDVRRGNVVGLGGDAGKEDAEVEGGGGSGGEGEGEAGGGDEDGGGGEGEGEIGGGDEGGGEGEGEDEGGDQERPNTLTDEMNTPREARAGTIHQALKRHGSRGRPRKMVPNIEGVHNNDEDEPQQQQQRQRQQQRQPPAEPQAPHEQQQQQPEVWQCRFTASTAVLKLESTYIVCA